ncbi:Head domain of trimeric autotransporter adhesin [Lysobacter sp. yr284]|nr:Head domain of trimeric autotransporter adhesin [Lysobacter sp. yr284]
MTTAKLRRARLVLAIALSLGMGLAHAACPNGAGGNEGEEGGFGNDTCVLGDTAFGDSNLAQYGQAFGFANSAIGTDQRSAVALGWGNGARGAGAVAIGLQSKAEGARAFSAGDGASSTAQNAIAIGGDAAASAENAVALGAGSVASGLGSSAFGYISQAQGEYSTALGQFARALGQTSTAVGAGAFAETAYTTAVGAQAVASNYWATAVGQNARATGEYSTAIGRDSQAEFSRATAVGVATRISGDNATAVGTDASAAENAVAFGRDSKAATMNSTALGSAADASGAAGVAVGYASKALGVASVALGTGAEVLAGNIGTAIGFGAKSSAFWGVALGNNSSADRDYAVSIGSNAFKRQLINLQDGTQDTDAVNLRQLKNALNLAPVAAAFGGGASYADGVFSGPTYAIQGNSFGNAGDAFVAIDGELSALKARADLAVYYDDAGKGSVTLKGGGGGGGNGGDAATGTQVKNLGDAVDDMDAVNKRQMEAGDLATLESANGYTDTRERELRGDMASGDATVLVSAKTYTDTTATATLTSANAYTDSRFNALSDAFDTFRGDVDRRFQQQDRRIDRLAAMSGAYAGMAMNTAGLAGQNRIGVGVGGQGGAAAMAIGYQRTIGERASVSIGAAFGGGERSVMGGAGYSW